MELGETERFMKNPEKYGHPMWALFNRQFGTTRCLFTITGVIYPLDKQQGTVRKESGMRV